MGAAKKIEAVAYAQPQRSWKKLAVYAIGGIIAFYGLIAVYVVGDFVAGWYSSSQRAHMMSRLQSGQLERHWYHSLL